MLISSFIRRSINHEVNEVIVKKRTSNFYMSSLNKIAIIYKASHVLGSNRIIYDATGRGRLTFPGNLPNNFSWIISDFFVIGMDKKRLCQICGNWPKKIISN